MTRRIRKLTAPNDGARAVVGIDPSLAGMGVALLINGGLAEWFGWTEIKKWQQKNTEHLCWWKIPPDPERKELNKIHRIHGLATWVAGLIGGWKRQTEVFGPCSFTVAIEGYAFSKRSTGLSDIHELCGIIKSGLYGSGTMFRIYGPESIKLAATGNGHATKEEMKTAFEMSYGIDLSTYGPAGENIADAALAAQLLNTEMSVREGHTSLSDLGPKQRDVLLRTTKANPVALVSRPLMTFDAVDVPLPVLAVKRGAIT